MPSPSSSSTKPGRDRIDADEAVCEIDLRHRGFGERYRHAFAFAERQLENVAAAKILDRRHMAEHGAQLVFHRKPDQVRVIELVVCARRRQVGAIDEQLGSRQRLGGAAVRRP